MSQPAKAYVGGAIHDGKQLHDDKVLLAFADGRAEIAGPGALPEGVQTADLNGATILPGFVDLQVNGGGGVMFNDDQSIATLQTMAAAHASIGTAALLPTLITDRPDRTQAAIDAVEQAMSEGVDGIVGIHLEGPHLSVARKGAHDPTLIRSMTDSDLQVLLKAADRLPNVMITVAPENCTNAQIAALSDAGIIVSLGHSDACYNTCMAAFDAGARCVTHLFNAMSQLGNREPGLVGAALSHGDVHAGLIADAIHVHPATIRAALDAKVGADRVFLVSDAMATAGSAITQFTLNGRGIHRQDGRLTLGDGTLAGADLELSKAISVLVNQSGQSLGSAIAKATSIPAGLLRDDCGLGQFQNRLSGLFVLNPALNRITRLVDFQS
ncbi:MAG: N-acetylglucosamine-6-phosphate deacetylase [Sulfitobacter sp.]